MSKQLLNPIDARDGRNTVGWRNRGGHIASRVRFKHWIA